MKDCHVVDSSAWLEYLADTDQADHFAKALQDPSRLVVPVITIYEVFKKVLRERGEGAALQAASQMQGGLVVDMDQGLVLEAARLHLPMADSLIYATARRYRATLWTQDEHFQALPGVRYFPKP